MADVDQGYSESRQYLDDSANFQVADLSFSSAHLLSDGAESESACKMP